MLGIQVIGVLSVAAWVSITMTIVFTILKKTIGLRVSEVEEINGLDIEEHAITSSYADFVYVEQDLAYSGVNDATDSLNENVSVDRAVPVVHNESASPSDELKITKLVMIIKSSKFEKLKSAMNDIGVSGMTVTQVLGCGMQKGVGEYYRGVPVDMTLLPKVKVEMVVCKVSVQTVIDTAKKVLYTGHIGDGKIFVFDVENVIKVRTGEEGLKALQDDE